MLLKFYTGQLKKNQILILPSSGPFDKGDKNKNFELFN